MRKARINIPATPSEDSSHDESAAKPQPETERTGKAEASVERTTAEEEDVEAQREPSAELSESEPDENIRNEGEQTK